MFEAAVLSWSLRPGWLILLGLTAFFYFRGWRRVSRILPERFPVWRAMAFFGGLLAFYAAVASPLDTFAPLLLQAHMVQHLLLTMLAAPLLLMGAPLVPLLRGLPRSWAREAVAPLLVWPPLARLGSLLVFPPVALGLFMLSNVIWHVPAFYDGALQNAWVHELEHASFLLTAVLFWWPVIEPWPYRRVWPRWAMIPYLLIADLQNTALAGFMSFYEGVLYNTYAQAPRLFGMSAQEDQAAAAAFMWVPGSIAYLVPAGMIAWTLLMGRKGVRPSEYFQPKQPLPAPVPAPIPKGPLDLLRLPWIGPVLRSLAFRRGMQLLMFGLAVLVVLDGLLGPQVSPLNLAGVLPWTYWRAFAVVALLVLGNLFCFSCPFMLVRDLGRKIWRPRWRWPRWLRLKWSAVVLVLLYLWAYEAWALWDRPHVTAWLVLGYFGAATVIDGLFHGASFCKYVCPIGQFHFTQSLASPFQVKVREPDVCATCRTHDCIRGNEQQRGCELSLFQPRKQGNMDCTFCLDCVRACPVDNVGLIATPPAQDVWVERHRSGVGTFSRRPDLAALCLVFVFGAFANAAGMVTPFLDLLDRILAVTGQGFRPVGVALFLLASCVLLPGVLVVAAGRISRGREWKQSALAFSYTLVPLGLGMWAAHFLFHLLTGMGTVVPAMERFWTGTVWSVWMPPFSLLEWLLPTEMIVLNIGFLISAVAVWRVGERFAEGTPSRWRVCWPWFAILLFLYYLGCWIFFQPMEMRGTMLH